jgi:putative ABC transport system permease protein
VLWLAVKTLLRERGRFLITLVGITVSTVLTLVEIAIYLGMMGNATAIIRHTDADIWIASKNVQSFDFALPYPEERISRVRSFPQIARADKILVSYGFIKLADGGRDQVQLVGYDPDTGVGGPWSMQSGSPADVKGGRYMILDVTSEQRLGTLTPGTQWELTLGREHAFKLVGLSQGIKSFTTIPLVFMSYNQLQTLLSDYGGYRQTSYIVAKVKDPAELDAVVRALRALYRDNDVYTRDEFVARTVRYWTIQTGMGMAFFLTAFLAMAIGGAIVGQTIYASTLEHLREYGTLKALGAENSDIYKTIFFQAGLSGVAGFTAATVLTLLLRAPIEGAGVDLLLSPWLFPALFLVVVATCLLSAWVSVAKIRGLDPVTVFKG